MAELNRKAAEVMSGFPVNACTDITGFGLLGHTYEMAFGSKVNVKIAGNSVPLLPEAAEAAKMGLVPAGAYANRGYLSTVEFAQTVPENIRDLCFDPQTSGGLLISVPAADSGSLLEALHKAGVSAATIIGEITTPGKGEIYVY